MVPFKEIRFGFASAEKESADAPELLIDGYYDFDEIISEVTHGSRFLVLGYKGSGKSAVAERLKLMAENDSELFVTTMYLSEFPYTSFKKIVSGDSEPESKYPTAWAWLIPLTLLQSFKEDNGGSFSGNPDSVFKRLEAVGLMPAPSLKELVLVSSKQSFRALLTLMYRRNHNVRSIPRGRRG